MPQDLGGHIDVCIDEDTVSQRERWVVSGASAKCGTARRAAQKSRVLFQGPQHHRALLPVSTKLLEKVLSFTAFFFSTTYI